jgi:hypothetical protein
MLAYAAGTYLMIVLTGAMLLVRELQLAGQDPSFAEALCWQALVHGLWLPVAGLVWLIFRRLGANRKSFARYIALGCVAIPLHAVPTTFIDISYSMPAALDLPAQALSRVQLDLLTYSAFALLAVAAEFQRRAATGAEEASALALALETARRSLVPRSEELGRLMVSTGSRRVLVALDQVEWFGSAGNYVVVNWQEQEGLMRRTLQSLETELNPRIFARSHRGVIVNLAKVESAQAVADGSWRLIMASGGEVTVSRTYRDHILDRLNEPIARPS